MLSISAITPCVSEIRPDFWQRKEKKTEECEIFGILLK